MQIHFVYLNGPNAKELDNIEIAFIYLLIIEDAYCVSFFSHRCLNEDQMEEQSNFPHWDELIPDALGLIFSNLSLQEVLTVIPSVCKSWRKAVIGPYCWLEIDIEEWSNQCQPDHLDQMLRMLITRSNGSLRKLCVSGLQNDTIFSFITEK